MSEELKYIIESLLFVSEGPLPMDRLKKVLEEFDPKAIRQAMDALAEEYEARGGGFMLREVAGGFQIRTRPDFAPWIKRLVQPGPQRLSKAALETLAIIAYKQPVIRADIEFIRGVDCGGVLRMLMEKKLVRVLGRKEIPGRPMIYATTKHFLEIFDLKDLKDLPSPSEIEALGASHILDTEPPEDDAGQAGKQTDADDTNARGSFSAADTDTMRGVVNEAVQPEGPETADDEPSVEALGSDDFEPSRHSGEPALTENQHSDDRPVSGEDEPADDPDKDSTAIMADTPSEDPGESLSKFLKTDTPFQDEIPHADDSSDGDEPGNGKPDAP